MKLYLLRPIRIAISLGAVLAAVVTVLHALAKPAASHAFFAADSGRVLVIAHQGGDGLYPGNTLYAMEKSVALGVDVLEMDIHSTVDGVLVLMHDTTVDRTTDGSGEIRAMTLTAIKLLDAGYDWSPDGGVTYPYRGQGIAVPTLEDIFTAFPHMRMNIEIKQAEPPIAAPFCSLIREHGVEERVLVASFRGQALDEFRALCPEVATSAYTEEVRTFFAMNVMFLGGAYSSKAHALQVPEYNSGLHVLSPRFVRTAQSRNLQVHAWTINEVEVMRRILATGVDGIITDYPDRLLAILNR